MTLFIRAQAADGGSPADIHCDWLKGFKSGIGYWQPAVDTISMRGQADVELMGFESPGVDVNFMEDHRQGARDFFCSPAPDGTEGQTRIASAHSLGAFLLLELLADDETAEIIADKYDGIFLANPFLGDRYDYYLARLFSKTAAIRDQPVGSTMLEKAWNGELEEGFEENPTHHQRLVIGDEVKKFMKRMKEQKGFSEHVEDMPIRILTGRYDPVCSNKTIRKFAEKYGIDYTKTSKPADKKKRKEMKRLSQALYTASESPDDLLQIVEQSDIHGIVEVLAGHNPMIESDEAMGIYLNWCHGIHTTKRLNMNMDMGLFARPESSRAASNDSQRGWLTLAAG